MTTRTALPSAARGRRLVAILAVGGALALTGCSEFSPAQTDQPYQPADGVAVDLGTIQIRNLVIVAPAKDGPGTLSANVINSAGTVQTISFADASGNTATAQIPAYLDEQLSKVNQVQLAKVPVPPGGIVRLQVSTAAAGNSIISVPVLSEQSYYKTVQPTAPPTTATSTATTTAAPTATTAAAG